MRKSHLEEMKTFLLRISEEKVSNNVFENCVVMEYVENEEQKAIVLPELDSNIADMSVENEVENIEYNADDADDISIKSENTGGSNGNFETVEKEMNENDSIPTSTEESLNEAIKGARSVDYVESNLTFSTNSETQNKFPAANSLHETGMKKSTEMYGDFKTEIHSDTSDEVVLEKEDIVASFGEKNEKSVDISPEEYTSGCGGEGRKALSGIVSIITVMRRRLW